MKDSPKEVVDEKKAHTIQTNIMVGRVLENIVIKLKLTTISELRCYNNYPSVCQVLLEEDIGECPFIVWSEVLSYIFSGITCTDYNEQKELKKTK